MKKEYLTALGLLGLQVLISAVYVYLFMQLLAEFNLQMQQNSD